jgi:hypothetical protein
MLRCLPCSGRINFLAAPEGTILSYTLHMQTDLHHHYIAAIETADLIYKLSHSYLDPYI